MQHTDLLFINPTTGLGSDRERRVKSGAAGDGHHSREAGSGGAGDMQGGERSKASGFKDPNINFGKDHGKHVRTLARIAIAA